MKKVPILIFLTILMVDVCYGQYAYEQLRQTGDGWTASHLQSLKVDTSGMYRLFNQMQQGEHKIHSILVVKDNQLVVEQYFNGHSADKPHDLRSATKSIISVLVGIAIDKGFVESVDDPISKYLSISQPTKTRDERKENITIRHLLTMSSGLDCNDWDKKSRGQEDRVYKKRDWIQYTLDLPMVNEPGEVSNYCSMGVVLAAEIIDRASGMSIQKFAEKFLLDTLGINNFQWGHTSGGEVIPSARRLYMTPRDMAKIGQLILNKGNWDGQQVVPAKWIMESTASQTKITGMDYGYLWWNIPFEINGVLVDTKTATGNGGQYIVVVPELEMVVVFTGGAYNSQEDKVPFAIARDILLPMFMDESKKEYH